MRLPFSLPSGCVRMCVLLYAVSLVLDLFIYLLNLVEPVCYGVFSISLIFLCFWLVRSWTSRFQIEKDGLAPKTEASNKTGLVKVEIDKAYSASLVRDVLPTAAPEFQEKTEDGTCFRIYKIGSLEIRTTQERFAEEQIGVVYSSRAPTWNLTATSQELSEREKVVECKVFLEAAEGDVMGKQPYHLYLMCITANKNIIVTEKLANGSTIFLVNPKSLEDRNSLAKQLFKSDCVEQATVKDVKTHQINFNKIFEEGVSLSVRKQYVKSVFKQLTGKTFKGRWGGFIRRYAGPSVFLGGPSMVRPMDGKSGLGLGNGYWTAGKKK